MQRVLPLICLMLVWQVSSLLIHPTKIAIQPAEEFHKDDIPTPKYKLFEGDIRMPIDFDPVKLSQQPLKKGERGSRTKRNAVANRGFLWPEGIIPYTISQKFNKTSKKLFRESMKTLEDMTTVNGKKCIHFVPRSDEDNFIHLEMLKNCWSEMGRLGTGRQLVSLGIQCYSLGTVMHELIHALGFYHEQSRADRDHYVDVHWENIKKGAENNFDSYALGTLITHLDQPYDYDSIMHYGPYSFTKDPSKPTITTKIKLTNGVQIGQRDHLSVIDIKMIQKLYSCDKNEFAGRDPNGPCYDKLEHCNLYGKLACDQLPKWAEENCAVTCGICTPDCSDKRDDCKDFDKELICTGSRKDWGEQHCAKFCGLGDCQYITTPKPAASCVDKIDDCADYQGDFCNEYRSWSVDKCPRYCNFCPAEVTTTPTAPPCQDLMDCSHLSAFTCTFAHMKKNCARHCKLCPDQNLSARTTKALPPTTKPPTTTTPKPTTTDPDCFDAINDCEDYGKSICKNYYDWSKINCKKFCRLCGDNVHLLPTTTATTLKTTTRRTTTPTTTTTTPTTTATTPPTTTEGECVDELSDCDAYADDICTSYADWSKKNCRAFCQFCIPITTTTTQDPNCYDKINDCVDYTQSICKNYPDWARTNCEKFCNFCGESKVTTKATTPITTKKTTTIIPTTTAPKTSTEGECYDDLSDCEDYGKDTCTTYADWAKTNCRMFCNFCQPKYTTTTTASTTTQNDDCKDALSDCAEYTKTTCSTYPDWSKLNCAKFCGFCGTKETCVDKIDYCHDYGESDCSNFAAYMKENCASFCGFC